MKLIKIIKSTAKGKKWTAIFSKDDKEQRVNFGAKGYLDYTLSATDKQREAYRARHDKEKNQPANTPGALSYHVLWGDSKSMKKNIDDFKKKYNLS